jgi:hypothetical protein
VFFWVRSVYIYYLGFSFLFLNEKWKL